MKCHRQTFLQQTCACLFVCLSDSSWLRWMSLVTCFRLSEKTEGAWTCWEVCWTRFETRRRLRTPESTKQTKCKKHWQGFFWLPSVAQVNLDVGTTTWNPGFMLFETKLAGIDTFRCLEYRLQVLNKVGWFFIDDVKLLESVFGKQNSWPILFWPNKFEHAIPVGMAKRIHWWTERSIYLAIYLSLSLFHQITSLPIYLSTYRPVCSVV